MGGFALTRASFFSGVAGLVHEVGQQPGQAWGIGGGHGRVAGLPPHLHDDVVITQGRSPSAAGHPHVTGPVAEPTAGCSGVALAGRLVLQRLGIEVGEGEALPADSQRVRVTSRRR